ncbi:hypothetical protein [Burkholderia sp. TSV86]|uniref:hypothetical protein n=1 Tax=Burkholderia sp. TSV86 TaxID=1385594 RepID=UPI000AAF4457|nr:hypothetical protein [Burkholderia sp. TSV86]
MAAVNPESAPSYAVALDSLRRVCHRQVVRYWHGEPFEALAQMGFVVWVRQPVRVSQAAFAGAAGYRAPVEVAELTVLGCVALDWLVALEATPHWETLRARPYGARDHQGTPGSVAIRRVVC